MHAGFAAIIEVQRLMSFHDASSDVSRLNREAFRKPVRVHKWTWQVLTRAQEFSVRSGGEFDITIAPLLSKWGYLPGGYSSGAAATFRDIILGPDCTIRFARPLSIDLGGIAKGFAVDCAVSSLLAAGIKSGIVNAGGDLRVFGAEPHQVYLRDPAKPERRGRNRSFAKPSDRHVWNLFQQENARRRCRKSSHRWNNPPAARR